MLERFHPLLYRALQLVSWIRPAGHREGVCLVVAHQNKGWILDRYAQEIASVMNDGEVHYGLDDLPKARCYFFSHVSLLLAALKRYPSLHGARITLMHTHLLDDVPNLKEILYVLRHHVDVITCMNSGEKRRLIGEGVPEERLKVLVGGLDGRFFSDSPPPSTGNVLICSAYYPRKSPQRLLDIARQAPHLSFTVLGPGWPECELFDQLSALANMSFVDLPFEEYLSVYRRHDRFLSASLVEGGPIPLLEAMAGQLIPVTSDTGFARDVIKHGETGYIFDQTTPTVQIVKWLESSDIDPPSVRDAVSDCTWERYAFRAAALISGRDSAAPSD